MEKYGYSKLVRTNPDYKKLGHYSYEIERINFKEKILELISYLSECNDYMYIEPYSSEIYYWALSEGYKKETNESIYIHRLKR